jgi:hypothetical protein
VADPGGTPQYFTIDVGGGTTWVALQAAGATASGKAFNTSDTSTSRARSAGFIVPKAPHFLYLSHIDDAGNGDAYYYVDTLWPEGGVHPYTFDPVTGNFNASRAGDTPAIIPDMPTRVRVLEGAIRGPQGTTYGNPDKRLDDIESRLAALETWGQAARNTGPVVLAGNIPTVSAAVTNFAPIVGNSAGAASSNQGQRSVMPHGGMLKNLYVKADVAPGAGKSLTITVRKNGTDSAVTVTLSGASQVSGSDLVNTLSVAAGDELEIKTNPASNPATTKVEWGVDYVATDSPPSVGSGAGGTFADLHSRGDAV